MFNKLIEMIMPNPKLAKPMVSELVDQYKPLLYGIAEEIFNIYKDYIDAIVKTNSDDLEMKGFLDKLIQK